MNKRGSLIGILLMVFISGMVCDYLVSHVPTLLWSGNQVFNGKLVQHHDDISVSNLRSLITSTLDQNSPSKFAKQFVHSDREKPEILVVFIDPKAQPLNSKKMPTLYNAFSNGDTSLSFPYTYIRRDQSFSDAMSEIATQVASNSVESRIIVAQRPGAHNPSIERVEVISRSQLNNFFAENDISTNGIVDLLIVKLDGSKLDDGIIQNTMDLILKNTNGKFVAVYTSDYSPQLSLRNTYSHADRKLVEKYLKKRDSTDNYSTYFPPGIWEAIIVIVVLLTIAFVGLCCALDLQTPQRYEVPRIRQREN
eukprot:TRINITY_DN82_c2_g1_i1.p1 TRINITY_DN82_c2_g1~~TRINITY_DN82_c2_g1_i1.p1  ORF type:complete len:308 (-),score=130.49 TRINITY_DN82_c2_g1_i1:107-1030(-)